MKTKTVLTPFFNNLILEPIAATGVSEGGIIVPEAHQKPLNQGKVLDKGPQVSDSVNKGDIVFFAMHTESKLNWRGVKLLVVSEDQCLGKFHEQEVTEDVSK